MSPFLVSLLGARMYYAVPRILHGAGRLERFFTDFSAASGWLQCLNVVPPSVRPASLARLLARVPQGIPPAKVTAFNRLGWEYACRRRRADSPSEQTAAFLWCGREFCRLVNTSQWGNAAGVFTFNSAGLETLQKARGQGLRAVMEQTIAPRQVERQILACEYAAYPGWQLQPEDGLVGEYSERERAEWAAADTILCGSQFVVDGIRRLGGPVEKCIVVPYGVDLPEGGGGKAETLKAEMLKSERRGTGDAINHQLSTLNRPLRVLTVGAVGLRKGAPYVLAAARQLKGRAEFRWVGGVELLPAAAQRMAECVHLTGAVPSIQVTEHFQWADVFLLPSLCEGSATVTYEALGHSLPVVCTPNTGSVVRDGGEGFIVPVRDATAIAERIERLAIDVELRTQMAANAKARAAEFTVAEYGRRLLSVLPS
jgi:glycosyltransferase involved in cell wall biosynthesis